MWGRMEVLSTSSYLSKPSYLITETRNNRWTQAENKMFENLLAVYDKDTPDRWQKVAEMIPGKTIADVIRQYKELEEDVSSIEAGLVPIPPGYGDNNTFNTNSPFRLEWVNDYGNYGFDGLNCDKQNHFYHYYGKKGGTRPCEQERKKGVPWTEEEHKLFLMGLKKYGKGDWRNISRKFVVSRTPTQVASHAQKYFIRQLSGGGKDKRRASIHDITTVNLDMNLPLDSPSQSKSPPAAGNNLKSSNLQLPLPPMLDEQQQSTTAGIGFNQNHLAGSTLLPLYGSNPHGYAIKLQNLQQQYHVDGYQSMGFQMMQQHYPYG